jgi:uncharacterized membrane protein
LNEAREFYNALFGLLKALVGIVVAFFVIFLFIYLLPVMLRIVGQPEFRSVSELLVEFARAFGAVMGGLLWAILGLVVAIFVLWALAMFLPPILKAKPWKQIKIVDEASATLRTRYAKGELTKEQYLEMKKTLEDAKED